MADAIVTQIFESLYTALSLERSRLEGVKQQVDLLQLKFRFMKRLLRDAEMKTKTPGAVEEIIVLAHDVEDVIDSYLLYLEQQNTKNLLFKMINIHNKLVTLQRFSKDIEAISTRAQTISGLKSEYINTEAEETLDATAANNTWRRRGIPTTQEIDVVGFQDESLQLINLLKEQGLHQRVISIIGMGGRGNTTLAQMIYNDSNVTNYFDIRIWISLSQEYQERDVLANALMPLIGEYFTECMNTEELKKKLFEKLSIKKYLLIVDDIWNVDAWDQISQNFPNNNNGSRVLLTTRNKEVTLCADPSSHNHYELRMLNKDESWELFLKKVFSMPDDSCPKELESLGREIVQKCGGTPLAILVAGGLLMGKDKSHEEWSRVNECLSWHLSQDSSKCRQILMFGYSDLPYYLKSCFLYLGMFPKDFEVPAQRVIRLWVAEGFVQERGQLSMEDVAEDCLEQLCQRSLIQVKQRGYHQGPIKTFRVHNLLRELVISEGKKYQFMDNNDKYSHHIPKPRRFAINLCVHKQEAKQFFTQTTRNLRCLLFFHSKFRMANSWMSRFVDGNKLLRVLDLEGVKIKNELPKEIGDFAFLHYLGLCFTGVKSLPSSIGNLIKLQTLDLRHTLIQVLPKSIWKLKNLRHILFLHWFPSSDEEKNIPFEKDVGINLTTLIGVSGVSWTNEDGTGLSNVFAKQKSLRSLHVQGEFVVKNHQSLRDCFPMSLTELFLVYTSIEEDPSTTLGSLPLLKALYLQRGSYVGNKMNFPSGTFPQLQYLYIGAIELSEWTVEDGAIPILRQLSLFDLGKLERLPDGLRNVTTLQKIEVSFVPRVQRRIQRDGKEWHIVATMPNFERTEFTGPPRRVLHCDRGSSSDSE